MEEQYTFETEDVPSLLLGKDSSRLCAGKFSVQLTNRPSLRAALSFQPPALHHNRCRCRSFAPTASSEGDV